MNRLDRGATLQSSRDGAIVFQDFATEVDALAFFHVAGDPNGVYSAPQGSLASGLLGPWLNIDGATAWAKLMFAGGPAGGDLFGFYPDPTVVGLYGRPIDSGVPANGDALLFDAFTGIWTHAPITFGGGPPVGPAGGDLSGLYPNPAVTGLQLAPLPVIPVADGFLKRNAGNVGWEEVAYGAAANTVCEGDDVRLSNARTPTAHASTHAGGSDPLTVDPATATNNAYVIGFHETAGRINADFRVMGSIDQTVAVALPGSQTAHLRTMDVVFPPGWIGGSITVNGIGSLGQAVAEVHAFPPGGGRSSGVKTFATVSNYTNSAPAGGPPGTTASITIANLLGVSNYPVKAFIKVSNDGTSDTFAATDLVNGTYDTTSAHTGNHTIEVWYTIEVSQAQNSHTHTLSS
jgi:hypothetical protein